MTERSCPWMLLCLLFFQKGVSAIFHLSELLFFPPTMLDCSHQKERKTEKRLQVPQTGEFCIIFSCQIPISVFLPLRSQRAHNLLSTVRETTKLHCCSANRLRRLTASLAVNFAKLQHWHQALWELHHVGPRTSARREIERQQAESLQSEYFSGCTGTKKRRVQERDSVCERRSLTAAPPVAQFCASVCGVCERLRSAWWMCPCASVLFARLCVWEIEEGFWEVWCHPAQKWCVRNTEDHRGTVCECKLTWYTHSHTYLPLTQRLWLSIYLRNNSLNAT